MFRKRFSKVFQQLLYKTNKTWILKTTKISILSFKSPSNFTRVSPNSTECHNASLKSPFMNTYVIFVKFHSKSQNGSIHIATVERAKMNLATIITRSSTQDVFCKKAVLKNFAKVT